MCHGAMHAYVCDEQVPYFHHYSHLKRESAKRRNMIFFALTFDWFWLFNAELPDYIIENAQPKC